MNDKMFYENISKQMQEDKEKIKQLEEENKQLKDNWNSLKESLKFDIELYDTLLLHRKMTSDKILKEMEELEKGGSNE